MRRLGGGPFVLLVLVAVFSCGNVDSTPMQSGNRLAHAGVAFKATRIGDFVRKAHGLGTGTNGGLPCIACTLVTSLLDQMALIHQKSVDQIIEDVCDLLPEPLDVPCRQFFQVFGDEIVRLFLQGLNADDVCRGIQLCNSSSSCRLWPQNEDSSFTPKSYHVNKNSKWTPKQRRQEETQQKENSPQMTPWEWLLHEIDVLANQHEPIVDFDSDLFAYYTETLRGSFWRGKDCDDFSGTTYPGRRVPIDGRPIDYNCNGVDGVDNYGESYKDMYCANSQQRGIAILGDSAAAHFHIPVTYMTAAAINSTTFSNAVTILENEFDWPQYGWVSAHYNTTIPDCPGPVDSLYLRLRERNLCNHRDFQNIGVNGAGSSSMSEHIEVSLSRNQTTDYPLLVIYALIGNDVCHPEHTLDAMTTPQEFHENILRSLQFLDNKLPAGSYVVLVGLVDGRVLWDTMSNLTHPIGTTYARVYDFLNCLELNPCWAWLNSNETLRNAGSARAAELNQVYVNIVKNYTFKNFEMIYLDFPLPQVIKDWTAAGGKVEQLIEPIDGFHPSQIGNSLFAANIWNTLETSYPQFLGPVNPNNAKIASMFGDQGGY